MSENTDVFARGMLFDKYDYIISDLIGQMKKKVGSSESPILHWELLKVAVGYRGFIKVLSDVDSFTSDIISVGEKLSHGLRHSYFISELSDMQPMRYSFFSRILYRIKVKSAIRKRLREFCSLLGVLDKTALSLESLIIGINGAFASIASQKTGKSTASRTRNIKYPLLHVFSSAKAIFSAKGALNKAKQKEALAVSDHIKTILAEDGVDISELGLTPVGQYAEQNTKSAYTYPN